MPNKQTIYKINANNVLEELAIAELTDNTERVKFLTAMLDYVGFNVNKTDYTNLVNRFKALAAKLKK